MAIKYFCYNRDDDNLSNDIVGTRIGIYDILYECEEKTKCNHKLYHVRCSECGWETNMTKSDAKRVSECRHRIMLTQEQLNEWYSKNKKKCLHCGEYIPLGDLGFNEYKERKFCSSSCVASYYNSIRKDKNKRIYFCHNCGVELNYKAKYCSNKCQKDFQYQEYIKKWKNSEVDGMNGKYAISRHIRKYLMEKHNYKCSKCGWGEINKYTQTVPLEVHHKNGNYADNDESNLELLCPNCHSLTSNYKNANRGNGRKSRTKQN